MNILDAERVKAWIATETEWEQTARGLMVTVQMRDDFIRPDCMPPGVRVDEVMWWRRCAATGMVPVRLVRK